MKFTAYAVLATAALSFSAFGALSTCKSGASERKIEVTTAEGGKPPCEVKYTKEGETEGKVLWNAQNDGGYCSTKAGELVAKLTSSGWACEGDIVAEGGAPDAAAPAADAAKDAKPVEGKTEGN